MTDLHRILRRATARERVQRAIDRSAVGGLAGIVLAIALLAADRLAGGLADALATWVPAAALIAAGIAAGAIAGAIARVDRQALASRIDRALDLDDRLGSAIALTAARRPQDAAFAAFVTHDAERAANRVVLRDVAPWRVSASWGICAVGAVAVIAASFVVPRVRWADEVAAAVVADEVEQDRLAAADAIEASAQEIRAELPTDAPIDERVREDLLALERLAEQLRADEGADASAAREESAARLADMADRQASALEDERLQSDTVARRFGQPPVVPEDAVLPETPEGATPMSAREFAEAMRRGEFGTAADELDRLLEESGNWSDAERRSAAQALRNLAESARANETETAHRLEEERERLGQALRDQGLDQETIDELLPERDPPGAEGADGTGSDSEPPTEERLRRDGVGEDAARDLARDLAEQAEREERERRANEEADRLADAIDRTAREVEPDDGEDAPAPDAPTDTGETGTPDAPDQTETTPGGEPAGGDTAAPSEQGPAGDGDESGAAEDTAATETPPGAGDTPPSGTEPGAAEPGAAEPGASDPGASDPGASEPGASEPGEAEPGAGEPAGGQPGAGQDPAAGAPGEQPASDPSGAAPGESGTPPGGAAPSASESGEPGESGAPGEPGEGPMSGGEQLRRALRELAERQGDGTAPSQDGPASERLREMARRIADSMTPEEREEWAREWQRQGGASPDGPESGDAPEGDDAAGLPNPDGSSQGPGAGQGAAPPNTRGEGADQARATEDVEPVEGDAPGSTRLFEWTDPRRAAPRVGETTTNAEATRAARRAAERAIDGRTVPSRYHRLIERYFRRMADETPPADGASGAAPDKP